MKTAGTRYLPLPTKQLFVLCVCHFPEPVCMTLLSPFIYFMVRDFNITDDLNKIGYYVGYMASSFAAAQFLSCLPWGYISDRIGRRPVILIGLLGTIISILLFGLSLSYTWALASRMLGGMLNGNLGSFKSMIAELTADHSSNQRARAFSIMPLIFGIGCIVGPALGGFLNHPVEKYPAVFGGRGWITSLLETCPYFLPCFVGASLCTVGLVFGIFFLEETLGMKSRDADGEVESEEDGGVAERRPLKSGTATPSRAGVPAEYHTFPDLSARRPPTISTPSTPTIQSSPPSPRPHLPSPNPTVDPTTITVTAFQSKPISTPSKPTLRSLLMLPVLITITAYVLVCFQNIMYDGLYSIWAATPPSDGGLGFTSKDIGISLSVGGVLTLVMQLFLWPFLHSRWGTLTVFRFGLSVYIPLYFCQGFLRHLEGPYVWAGLMVCLAANAMCIVVAYTSSIMLVANSAPSLNALGTINGFAQCMASGIRAIGPALCGTLYSWALDEEKFPWIVRVHFMWAFLSFMAVGTWWWSFSIKEKCKEPEVVVEGWEGEEE